MTESEREYLKGKWRGDVTDPVTGLGLDALKRRARELVASGKGRKPWCLVKADLFKMICSEMAIGVSPLDFFPAFAVWSRRDRVLTETLNARIAEIDATHCAAALKLAKQYPGNIFRHDYDHAVPDWEAVLQLGFVGLLECVRRAPVRNDFTEAMEIAAVAMCDTVRRLAAYARTKAAEGERIRAEAEALAALAERPPATTYEVLLFQLLFFVFGEHVDHLQVRSLGNLDALLAPYFAADLKAGRLTCEGFKELLRHFFWQWGSIDNWWGQPVYLGGTGPDGASTYGEVSRIMLEVIDELNLPTPKFQLKIAANTPEDIWTKALDMARRHRSLVFCGEEPMARAMSVMGFSAEEARTCDLWGCYEFQPRAQANTTLPAALNLVSIVTDILDRARRGAFVAADFEAVLTEYLRVLAVRAAATLEIVRGLEAPMDEIVPALVHSLSIGSCVAQGRNAIGSGMKYNLTVVLQVGLGTAADALSAIREIVYEKGEMTLAELGEVMSVNWKGHETLRRRMLASRQKWGNGDPRTDALVRVLLAVFGRAVNGKPNARGGRFYASGHSIDFFRILNHGVGATPDGRRAGDELSKNISPTPGADREGATALVNGIARIGVENIPGDVILDVMLHPTTVTGDRGLKALRVLVERYFANGGCAIHFNVFDAEELLDAQRHPEKYENLQVRVCGWNVRWNDLTKRDQDAYIIRAREVMGSVPARGLKCFREKQ